MRARLGTPSVAIAWLRSARSSVKFATTRTPFWTSNVATAARSETAQAAANEIARGAARAIEARQVGERLVEQQQEAAARG